MRLIKYNIIAISLGLVLLFSEFWIDVKQNYLIQVPRPDLEMIINQKPSSWISISGSTVNPLVDALSIKAYDIVASRFFKSKDGHTVNVVLIWSRDGQRRSGHNQEICYNSQGFNVSFPKYLTISLEDKKLEVNTFTAHRQDKIEDVIYWKVTGGKPDLRNSLGVSKSIYGNYTARLDDLVRAFSGEIPDNLTVRVSTWRPSTDPPSTAHIDYIKSYLQSLDPKTRHFLTGL